VESDKRAFGRGVFHGLLLLEAKITCCCPRMKNNDGVITLTSEQDPKHALIGVGNHGS
jgi:hypothetical protein